MRTDRLSRCLGILLGIGLLSAFAVSKEDADRIRPTHLKTAADPDGEPVAVSTDGAVAAVGAENCQVIGLRDRQADSFGLSRFRGNVYRVEYANVELTEIKMEFDIPAGAEVDLFFSVHRLSDAPQPETYVRVANDVISTVIGVGAPVVYSSGPFAPLSLPQGDYVIGVGWSSPSFIFFWRDRVNYPLPFLHGQVLSRALKNAVAPPVADELTDLVILTDGAYSMQLCFEPVPGACCSPLFGAPGCREVLEDGCSSVGSFFFGQRATCSEHPCMLGACCDSCGNCMGSTAREACEAESGDFWARIGCPTPPTNLCPPITGACCFDDGVCEELCESDCEDLGGTYRDDGTSCDPNPCKGACCQTGGCTEKTPEACGDFTGDYKGDGTTCRTLPPELECGGACCFGFFDTLDFCDEVSKRSLCTFDDFAETFYWGDGVPCPLDPGTACGAVDVGACCLPDGLCINTTQSFCGAPWVQGEFAGVAILCDANTCQSGACCFADGTCHEPTTQNGCTGPAGMGASWTPDGTCDPNTCVLPTGACCGTASGDCTDNATEQGCIDSGGFYQGGDSTCAVNPALTCPGFGACCRSEGDCFNDFTPTMCLIFGGSYFGDGSTCSPQTCTDQRGACCAAIGVCLDVFENECMAIGGVFRGSGVACVTNTCPTGACCEGEACSELIVEACSGDYRGDDTACDATVVACGDVAGACCMGDETCSDRLPQECLDGEGLFQGAGVSCSEGLCVPGACCLEMDDCIDDLLPLECTPGVHRPGVTCSVDTCESRGACCLRSGDCQEDRSESTCTALSGTLDPEMTCDQVTCEPVGACCLPDLSCLNDRTESACTAAGGILTPATSCNQVVCQPIGACCNNNVCTIEAETDCQAAGGSFKGNESTCPAGGLCGACCQFDGTCGEDLLDSECSEPNAEFRIGQLCQNFCVARGACCVDTECQEARTQLGCENAGGFYDGDGTSCTPELCGEGVCCVDADACSVDTRQLCELDGGVHLGTGNTCEQGICATGSCCSAAGVCTGNQGELISFQCEDPADFRAGDTCGALACDPRGACCLPDESCQTMTAPECVGLSGTYRGDAAACAPGDLCQLGACCQNDGTTCTEAQTRLDCELGGGIYLGAAGDCTGADCTRGVCCAADLACTADTVAAACALTNGVFLPDVSGCDPNPCGLSIVSSDPPNCAIDARQPSDPDGDNPVGWTALTLTFDGGVSDLLPGDFTVFTVPTGGATPGIMAVVPDDMDPNTITLDFDQPITTGLWTCVDDGTSTVCLGALPADVNSGGASGADDLMSLMDCVAGIASCELWQCDLDRSGTCGPADILRAADLLHGADLFNAWLGEQLDPCPSAQ